MNAYTYTHTRTHIFAGTTCLGENISSPNTYIHAHERIHIHVLTHVQVLHARGL